MQSNVFNFGKRKILAVNYSRYISLPKDWLRNCGVDGGDELELTMNDAGDLILKASKKEDKPDE